MNDKLKKKNHKLKISLISGSLAGIASTIVGMPFD